MFCILSMCCMLSTPRTIVGVEDRAVQLFQRSMNTREEPVWQP